MLYLLLASLVWAFSFGLIKGQLAGLDPTAVAALRLVCALLVFLPFLNLRGLARRSGIRLVAIGAVQFGLMYVLYLRAFTHLQAHEIALYTIFTPIYLALLDAAVDHRWHGRHLVAAVLSLAGAGVLLWHSGLRSGAVNGFLLVQLSNLCFAAGQLAYKRERQRHPGGRDADVFALLYAGALAATAVASLFTTEWLEFHLTWTQTGVIVYLGIIASGVGFFWWNLGATRVNTGTLAVFNNAKIPLGVAVSLLFFGETTHLPRLLLSVALMLAAVAVAEGWLTPRRQESGARSPE
jgi:drug/metabolite transporter (DMT)-like permease